MDIKEAKKILSENKDITDEMIKQYVKSTEKVGGRLTAKDLTSKINFNERKEEYNNKKLRIFKLAYMFTCLLFVLLLGVGVLVSYNVGVNNVSNYNGFGKLTDEEIDVLIRENKFYSDNSVASINVLFGKYIFLYRGYSGSEVNYYYKLSDDSSKNSTKFYILYNDNRVLLEYNKLVKLATQDNIGDINTFEFDIEFNGTIRHYSIQTVTK